MGVTVLTGGARSGKSSLAVEMGARTGVPVTFVATAPLGSGMEERIARHRASRPTEWTTVEEPVDLLGTLAKVPPDDAVIVDCITLWINNLMLEGRDDGAIEAATESFAGAAEDRSGPTIVVTNEVGSGVHPATALGIRFQDLLGRVNTIVVARAERAYLCVAGRPLALGPIEEMTWP